MSDSDRTAIIDVTPGGEVGPPAGLVNAGHAIYACYAIGFFIGVTWFVGLIFAYVKRDEARGTWLESHFSWQIRTFWWSLVWFVVGWILFITIIGIVLAYPLWIAAFLWAIYRVVKGWIKLNDAKPVS